LLILLAAGSAAQAQSQYPMADKIAAKLVQKYQTSTCDQLAAERQAPPSAQKEAIKEQVGQKLRSDPAMRADFVNKVAAPVVDKMIVCGFVP
jgi:hypothetical protein